MSTGLQVAKVILEQMGGGLFLFVTGCKVAGDEDTLYITLPKESGYVINQIEKVKVKLVNDTYTMTFMQTGNQEPFATFDDVYDTMLQSIFETQTGLLTRP
jgi:hypothetical protein